jgi:glycosyltransferase involved in cell wall biosynthesis
MTPRVSVIVPVRNGLPFLRAALDSLYAQTFGDFEIIVVDDGSTDGTWDALRGERDVRLRLTQNSGRGLGAALNHGLRLSRGEYIARQDADDESTTDRLAIQTSWLDAHRDVAVLATCAEFVDANGHDVDNEWTRTIREQQDVATTPEELRALLPLTCGICHGSVLMRASVIHSVGGYREDYVPAEDYDLWLRLLPGGRIAKLPDRLYRYRVHGDQSSAARRAAQLERVISAKLEYLRRTYPLPHPARMAIADRTRGTQAYTDAATRLDFDLVEAPVEMPAGISGEMSGCDLFVVTDFSTLPRHAARFEPAILAGRVAREGNLFVRTQQVAR